MEASHAPLTVVDLTRDMGKVRVNLRLCSKGNWKVQAVGDEDEAINSWILLKEAHYKCRGSLSVHYMEVSWENHSLGDQSPHQRIKLLVHGPKQGDAVVMVINDLGETREFPTRGG